MHYCCLCQFLPCWKGCGDPKLGWVSVCLSAGRGWLGLGGMGLFMASGVLVKHRRFFGGYVKFVI